MNRWDQRAAQWITENTWADFGTWVSTGLRILVILILAWLLLRFLRSLIKSVGDSLGKESESAGAGRRVQTLTRVMAHVASVAVSIVTGLVLLSEMGVSVGPILGAAGIAGIAIGFGAQSLVKDFFTGFFILLEDQIRTGDVVTVAGYSGVVEQFNLRSTRLRDYEGNVHYIPNSNINGVTNMSRDYAFAVMDISVGYGEDTEQVFEQLRSIATDMQSDPAFTDNLLDELEIAGVDQLAESGVTIRCRIRVRALDQWRVRREFLSRTHKAFAIAGIEIPYPYRRVINSSFAQINSIQD